MNFRLRIIRIHLPTNCPNCKHNTSNCSKYPTCYDCPNSDDGICRCLQDATEKELITEKCKYFVEKE